jgi:hypothetical protein
MYLYEDRIRVVIPMLRNDNGSDMHDEIKRVLSMLM